MLRWEFVLSSAVLANGAQELTLKPGASERVVVKLAAPEVRHVSQVDLRVALLRGDEVRARDQIVLRVYPAWDPKPILTLLEHKRIGIADPSGRVAKMLADSGLTGGAMTTVSDTLSNAAAVCAFRGDALILGPGASQAASLVEAALEAATSGLTVLWLEPGDTSRWRDSFGLPAAWAAEPTALLDLAPGHPALADIQPDDLAPWRGEGGPRFVMESPPGGNFRGLVAAAGEKPGYGLLEVFPGGGRIVLCELPVVSRFGAEPAARMLFELLLKYAVSDVPRFHPAALWAPPDGKLPLLAEKAGLVVSDAGAPGDGLIVIAAGADAADYYRVRESSLADKIRAHLASGGKCLFIGAEPESSAFLERCDVRGIAFEPAPEKPEWTCEPVPLAWGISSQDIAAAARAGEGTPIFEYRVAAADGAKTAAAPGAIVKVPVGAGEAVLCQLALDRAPENLAVIAVFRQLLTNLGARLQREDEQ